MQTLLIVLIIILFVAVIALFYKTKCLEDNCATNDTLHNSESSLYDAIQKTETSLNKSIIHLEEISATKQSLENTDIKLSESIANTEASLYDAMHNMKTSIDESIIRLEEISATKQSLKNTNAELSELISNVAFSLNLSFNHLQNQLTESQTKTNMSLETIDASIAEHISLLLNQVDELKQSVDIVSAQVDALAGRIHKK